MEVDKDKKEKKEFWKVPAKAGDLLDSFFTNRKLINPYRLAQIKELWKDTCGDKIFDATKLCEIANRKLYIKVLDVDMIDRIEHLKGDLINSLNEKIGKKILTDIVIENKNKDCK